MRGTGEEGGMNIVRSEAAAAATAVAALCAEWNQRTPLLLSLRRTPLARAQAPSAVNVVCSATARSTAEGGTQKVVALVVRHC